MTEGGITNINISGKKLGNPGWFILAVVIFFTDYLLTNFNGINGARFLETFSFSQAGHYFRTSANMMALIIIIAYWIVKRPDSRELTSFAVLTFLTSIVLTLGYVGGSLGTLIHLVFAWTVLFGLAYKSIKIKLKQTT